MEQSRLTAVLACLLLVASMAGLPTAVNSEESPDASLQSPATAVTSPTNNTTARLTLPEHRVTQSEFETARIGIGSTLQRGSDSVRSQHRRTTVEREFEAASSLEEQRNVLDQALIDLKERSNALEAREREVIREYSDGNITGETLVKELARIDAGAREIEASLAVLRNFAESEAITVFDGRNKGVRFRAESLQGPVRHRVAQTMAGEAPQTRVFVTASDTGVVLSALIEDVYAREATNYRSRQSDEPNTVDSSLDQVAQKLYPWAWDNRKYSDISGALTASIYRISAPHPQGELLAYMDTGTADVFHEVQTFTVADMPTTMSVVRSESGFRVTLHRTYPGGPLDIVVEDIATGAVVNANVTIDGHELGHTGDDGHVRTIEPRVPYTVNVTNGDATLTVTIDRPFETSEG